MQSLRSPERHLTRRLFGDMLRRIWALPVVDADARTCLAQVVARRCRAGCGGHSSGLAPPPRGPASRWPATGPEQTAGLVRHWLQALTVQTLYLERRSPWVTADVESCTGTLWDARVARDTCHTLPEARVVLER